MKEPEIYYIKEHDYHAELRRNHEDSEEPIEDKKPELDSSLALLHDFFRDNSNIPIDHINRIDILNELDELSLGQSAISLYCPSPLTPFFNQINDSVEANSGNENLIPKILHVSFKSRCVGRDHAEFLSRWSNTLENYSIFFYDDESVDNLINQDWPEFPGLHEAMKCVQYKGAMTVDIWRVLILYKYGGIYTDIDNSPTQKFDESLIPDDVSAFFFTDSANRPSQWFMAMEPKHPLMYLCMKYIINNLLNMDSISGPRTVYVTGPGAVRSAYDTFFHMSHDEDDVYGGGIHTGLFGKTVQKISQEETILHIIYQNTKEMVAFNATVSMTRGDRIVKDTGVLHWDTVKYKAWKNKIIPDMSCNEFLNQKVENKAIGVPGGITSILQDSERINIPSEVDDSSLALLHDFIRDNSNIPIDHINRIDILNELDELSLGQSAISLYCPSPLTPFFNQINDSVEANSGNENLIPKILHVSFKSRCVGRDHAEFLSRWSNTLENYSIFFYDDESVDNLINQDWPEFPGLHEAMKCVQYKGAMTVDIWRVLILYKYGGIYTDIDNSPTQKFDESLIPDDVSAFFFTDSANRPSQWFMAMEPKHPLMYLCMKYIINNLLNMDSISGPRTVYVTGPGAVRSAYDTFFHMSHDEDDVYGGGIHTGLFGKTVQKISQEETILHIIYQNTKEMVAFNATVSMTRGDRIFKDTGVLHWDTVKYKAWKNKIIPDMSCKEFLDKIG